MNTRKILKYIILVVLVILLNIINMVISPHLDLTNMEKQYEVIRMGKYVADIPNKGKISEDIDWYVIFEDDEKKLLISKDILIPSVFNTYDIITTWEDSYIRKHLNSAFYESSFTERERKKILKTKITVDKNDFSGTGIGSETEDNIFILNNTEIIKYLNGNRAAVCGIIASACGCSNYYWTRTNGYSNSDMCCVDFLGQINKYGYPVSTKRTGIRPAMWIRK